MTILLAAALAGAATAVLVRALPAHGGLRLAALSRRTGPPPGRPSPAAATAALALPVALVAGPVAAVLWLTVGAGAARWLTVRRRGAAAAAERAGALLACRVLSVELSAGRTPAEALMAAAEPAAGALRDALQAAAAAARLGGDVPATLLAAGPGSAVPSLLRALAACWQVCAASGNGLAAAVCRLEEGLQAEQELRRTIDAELAGPRATALLLAVLPAAGLLMAAGLGADPLHVLLATPVGVVCLTAGLILDGLGLLWTQRLVARVRPP